MRVLMMAAGTDPHADRLDAMLKQRDVGTVWFDVAQVPHRTWAHLAIDTAHTGFTLDGVASDDIGAVFYRRLSRVRSLALWEHLPEPVREFAAHEAESTLYGLCHVLEDRPWINPARSRERAANKAAGLMIARRVGMRVPATLMSNDPQAVLAFYDAHDGKIVYKAVDRKTLRRGQDHADILYTNRVARHQIEQYGAAIQATPGIYQAEVPRQAELRITVVDDRIFCARIISGDPSEVDWRLTYERGLRSERAPLPAGLEEKILAFMQEAGLRYGAFDFIITPEGEAVFLEVNPQGAYLWLEHELGFPITQAIAEALIAA